MHDRSRLDNEMEQSIRAWGDEQLGIPPTATSVTRRINAQLSSTYSEAKPRVRKPTGGEQPMRSRLFPLAIASLLVIVSVVIFTKLGKFPAQHPTSSPNGESSLQQVWGNKGITTFSFDVGQRFLEVLNITPDGQKLIVLNYNYPCANPCPASRDATGTGIDTYTISQKTLQSLYLQQAVPPGTIVTDGHYIGFWEGKPGVAPNLKGQKITAIDLSTNKASVVASVDFTNPDEQAHWLSEPLVSNGVMLWGQGENSLAPFVQHLYLTDLTTGQRHLVALHVTQSQLFWPYVVYTSGDKLFVYTITRQTTRQLPLTSIAGSTISYSLSSSTLVASTIEPTASGYQLAVLGLDLTQSVPLWQPVVTVPSSKDAGFASMNDRLVVWMDTDNNAIKAWDRVQHKIVIITHADSKERNFHFQGRWLLTVVPSTDLQSETVTIIDTSVLNL